MWLAIAACGEPERPAPDAGCEATWDGFAGPFLSTWCLPCHSSSVEGDDRHGAPVGVDFETYAMAAQWAEAIGAAAGTSERMPPAGGVPDADREALAGWVACGAPGPTTSVPAPCDEAETVLTGDLRVTGATDADCVTEVTGSVLADTGGPLALPRLVVVGGDLSVGGGVGALSLPALERVGGTVSLTGALPAEVVLPRLSSVGALHLESASGIVRLDLPRLEVVGQDLRVVGAADLVDVVHTSDL